jgi:hypothetical protein
MTAKEKPKIPLPKDWTGNVRSAVLHVISLAQYATAYTRSWAANSPNERMRLKTENGRLEAEVALLTEEIRRSVSNFRFRAEFAVRPCRSKSLVQHSRAHQSRLANQIDSVEACLARTVTSEINDSASRVNPPAPKCRYQFRGSLNRNPKIRMT